MYSLTSRVVVPLSPHPCQLSVLPIFNFCLSDCFKKWRVPLHFFPCLRGRALSIGLLSIFMFCDTLGHLLYLFFLVVFLLSFKEFFGGGDTEDRL